MQLCKPSFSFGANQRSFSKYEHQEHSSESNYAHENKSASAFDSHAEEYVMGQSMVGFDANNSSRAMGNKSTNYYANAQSALPSPTLHVQQGHHAMGKMKKHEGYNGQDWGSNSPKYAAPAYVDHSRDASHDGSGHMMGGTAQPYYVGQSGYKDRGQKAYNYNNEGGIQGGYANSKSPILTSPKYLSPIKTNQPGVANKRDGYMMGKMDNGWGNSANYSSPTHGPRSSQPIMHQDEMAGDLDHGWANDSSPTHGPLSGLAMNKEQMMGNRDHGWANSPTKFSSTTPPRQSTQGMYKNDHLVESDDRGWGHHSPSKFSSPPQPQPQYSSRAIPKEGPMMGNMNNGWANSPTKYSGANNFNSSNNSLHSEDEQLGWASKSINGFGQNQVNHTARTPYAQHDHDQSVDDDVHDIMDEILTKYPSHNVSGGARGVGWGATPNAYGGQNQVGGYAKQQAYGASANYGAAAQSMSSSSSKFASNKEEYSASSRANKFQASSMLNSGRYY